MSTVAQPHRPELGQRVKQPVVRLPLPGAWYLLLQQGVDRGVGDDRCEVVVVAALEHLQRRAADRAVE